MKLSEMDLEDFFQENDLLTKDTRNRTVNIKDSIHYFYKNVANQYDVGMSTIIGNVLLAWKEEHKEQIKLEVMKRVQKLDL